MSTLASLKKKSSLDKLTKALQDSGKKTFKNEEGFWQPSVDKAGNGFALIRFLDSPAVDGDDGMPWVQIFGHGFQGPGGWYIENSLTTLGMADPVSEYNTKLWNTGSEANKKVARDQKRKLSYISNIYVIKDPANPENEGKTFLFKYGKKIFDKIRTKINPSEQEIAAAALEGVVLKSVNVFNFWEGANFKLKIRNVENYRNYDASEFESQTSALLDGDDKKIEALWKSLPSLQSFLDPKNFKSYDELQKKLNKVLGIDGAPAKSVSNKTAETAKPSMDVEDNDPPFDVGTIASADSSDDADMEYFNKLANG